MEELLLRINNDIDSIINCKKSKEKYEEFYSRTFNNDFFDFDYLKANYRNKDLDTVIDSDSKKQIARILYSLNSLSENGLLEVIQYDELKSMLRKILENIYNSLPLIDEKRLFFLQDLKASLEDFLSGVIFKDTDNLLRYFDDAKLDNEKRIEVLKDLIIGNTNIYKKRLINNNYVDSLKTKESVVDL